VSLTVSVGGSGRGTVVSTPAGINCGTKCSASYPSGTMVTLTASASPSSVFAGWSVPGCAGVGPCTVTMNGTAYVIATFSKKGH
jgi:hypothetical protein